MEKITVTKLSETERGLWEVKTEIVALAFLIKGLNPSEGGDDLCGVGLVLDRHARKLDAIGDTLLELLKHN